MRHVPHSPRSSLVADLVVIVGAVVFGAGIAAVGVSVLHRPAQVSTVLAGVLGLLLGAVLVAYGVALDQAHARRDL